MTIVAEATQSQLGLFSAFFSLSSVLSGTSQAPQCLPAPAEASGNPTGSVGAFPEASWVEKNKPLSIISEAKVSTNLPTLLPVAEFEKEPPNLLKPAWSLFFKGTQLWVNWRVDGESTLTKQALGKGQLKLSDLRSSYHVGETYVVPNEHDKVGTAKKKLSKDHLAKTRAHSSTNSKYINKDSLFKRPFLVMLKGLFATPKRMLFNASFFDLSCSLKKLTKDNQRCFFINVSVAKNQPKRSNTLSFGADQADPASHWAIAAKASSRSSSTRSKAFVALEPGEAKRSPMDSPVDLFERQHVFALILTISD